VPTVYEEYLKDFVKKAACERYFEKIIEASTDLASFIIRYKKFEIPEDDEKAFDILTKNMLIREELAKRLKEAKGMRNIIAHEYGKVDDVIVFHAVTEELIKDVRDFLDKIENVLDKNKNKTKVAT